MKSFKIGDRVEFTGHCGNANLKVGYTGTIVVIDHASIGVVWDNDIGGHNLGGECEYGYGWFVDESQITLLLNEFHIGDRVEFVHISALNSGRLRAGATGTVIAIRSNSAFSIGVEWDNVIGGHSLDKRCKVGHGWWVGREHIMPYDEEASEPASDDELMQFLFGK